MDELFPNRLKTIRGIAAEDRAWLRSQMRAWPEWQKEESLFLGPDRLENLVFAGRPSDKEIWAFRFERVIKRWRVIQSRRKRGKTAVSLDLSPEARQTMRELASSKGISQSALVEDLLKQARKRSGAKGKRRENQTDHAANFTLTMNEGVTEASNQMFASPNKADKRAIDGNHGPLIPSISDLDDHDGAKSQAISGEADLPQKPEATQDESAPGLSQELEEGSSERQP